MKIKFYFSFVFVFCALFCFRLNAQGPSSRWYFSNGAGLTISSATAVAVTGGQITNTASGCASIADANGNLLFYTDGVTVWNQSHAVMPNGTGLLGNNSLQSALILKKPGSATLYYIFTAEVGGTQQGLRYSVIDMALASGSGSVISKNTGIYTFSISPHLAATKHCNGTDYWIVGTGATGVVSFSLSATGVSAINLSPGGFGTASALKFSPNGKLLAFVQNYTVNNALKHRIGVFAFNTQTGLTSSTYTYIANLPNNGPSAATLSGCEFSPNGRYLYSCHYLWLTQFDLCGTYNGNEISNTAITAVNTNSLDYQVTNLQLAPNGKIYVSKLGQSIMGVIDNPNLPGNACNYNSAGASLGTATCGFGIPNFESSQFEQRNTVLTYSGSLNACQTLTFSPPYPCAATGYSATSYAWNFGDPSSANNTSTLGFPVHVFSNTGTYTVSLIVNYDCNKGDTIAQVVNVVSPTLSVLGPTLGCTAVSTTVAVLGGSGNYSYSWTPGNYTTAAVSNLASGLYTINFYDAPNNCRGVSTVSIQAINYSASVQGQNPLCPGQSNGSGTLNVLGGSGSFSYNWQPNGANSATAANLPAGTYTAYYQDNTYFCTGSRTIAIFNPAPLVLNVAAPSPDVCVGATASVYCAANGGNGPYLYNWLNGGSATTQTFTENQSGTYVYSVITLDANNCGASNTISLQYFNSPTLSLSSASVCSGTNYTLTAVGATNYTWQPGNTNGSQKSGAGFASTIFTVTGKTLMCTDTKTSSVTVYSLPTNTIIAPNALCEQSTAQFSCQSAFSYSWTGPSNFVSSAQSFSILCTPLASGVYTLQVSNNNGCVKSYTKTFTTNLLPQLSTSGPPAFCAGEGFTLNVVGADSYVWLPAGAATATYIPLPNGSQTYTVIGTSTATGCQNTATISVTEFKCTSIEELLESRFQIHPNPTTNFVRIYSSIKLNLEVLDVNGKVLKEIVVEEGFSEIYLDGLPAGLYLLRDAQSKVISKQKLVLTR